MYENSSENNTNNEYRQYYYSAGNGSIQNAAPAPAKKAKKPRPFLKKAASFICCGALFGVTAGAVFSVPAYMTTQELREARTQLEQMQSQMTAVKPNTANALSTTTDALSASNTAYTADSGLSVADIAESCLPSVVSITAKGVTEVRTMFGTFQQDSEGSGSGIIIGENETELLIVTNYHVVSGSNELTVVFSYEENNENPSMVAARIKGYDADKDLAVIAVSLDNLTEEMRSRIKIATIGDSSTLTLGQEVVAIGNALGYGQSVTNGIISALDREVTVYDNNNPITNRLIQTNAAINPGNSGGALLNMNGELIGINSVKVSADSVEGMGYAIPISDVQSIIEELALKETRDVVDADAQGYLGIGGTDVTEEISETYGMPVGIFINTVYDHSPAQAAGLAKGNIITKFDGQTVRSMSALQTLLTYYRAGETVEVTAMVQGANGYTEQTFSLTLGTKAVFGEDASGGTQQRQPQQEENNGNGYYNPFSFWSMP
ncbi:MAG: trypsin-like peptidase domain-containing protein [Roseburia sp.]|nr:trypsin-like peptidase domain-containing protein [Roseburia sp.]